jgi:hypothetical protein
MQARARKVDRWYLLSGALWNLSLAFGRVGMMRAAGRGNTTVDGWLAGDFSESLDTHVTEAHDRASATA